MRSVALTLLVLAAPAAALAQASETDSLARAVVLFEESETLYNQGEFVQAAALLRRAYSLHADATLLFNLGRALEGAGDLDGAIDAYGRYLAEASDPPDRGAVEARLATLRTQREALAAAEEDDELASADASATPAPSSDGPRVEPAPWILFAGGLATLGVAIGMGAHSEGLVDRAANAPVQRDAVALHDEASQFALAANVLFVAGGLLAAAGLVWGAITVVAGEGNEAQASLRIGPGSLALTGAF